MNNSFEMMTWYEFVLRAFALHWFVALLVVGLVASVLVAVKRLNATTRHNLWLLTLLVVLLMPLMVFAPKSGNYSPSFDFFLAPTNTGIRQSNLNATSVEPRAGSAENSTALTTDSRVSLTADNPGAEHATNVAEFSTANRAGETSIPATAASDPGASVGVKSIALSTVVNAIFVFWLSGALLLLWRLWGEYTAARELELQSDSVTVYFERRFALLCQRLGLKQIPPLRFHAGISAPMTVGLSRVWVAIPMQWRDQIDDDIFDQTLTHELGHIARRDPLVNTLQRLMNILFWMYPAVWYVSRQLEIERESACDDWVLNHDGKSHAYASNLLDVAESLYLQPHVLAVGCLRSHSQLSRRIQNLLNKSSDHKLRNAWQPLVLTGVGLFTTLSVSAVIWPSANAIIEPPEPLRAASAAAPSAAIVPPRSLVAQEEPAVPSPAPVVAVAEPLQSQQPPRAPQAPPPALPLAQPEDVSAAVERSDSLLVSVAARNSRVELEDGTTSVIPLEGSPEVSLSVINDRYGKSSLTVERVKQKVIRIIPTPPIDQQLQPILYAAWTGDSQSVVDAIVRKEVDVDERFRRSMMPRTLMEAAILQGHTDLIAKLIELGAQLDAGGSNDISLLTVAATVGRNKIASLLIKHGAETDASTFAVAVQHKNVELVQRLLRVNVEPDANALIIAVRNQDKRMVTTLLKKSDCSCLNIDAALLVAVKNRDLLNAQQLLRAGAVVEDEVLRVAIQNRDKKMLRQLVRHLSDKDVDDDIVNLAVHTRDSSLLSLLLDAGAEADESSLMLAVQYRDTAMVKRLLRSNAKVGEGTLVLALQSRDVELTDMLLATGAKPGDGALVIALQYNDIEMVHRLLRAGAKPEEGALIIAIQNGNAGMVELLLKNAAEISENAFQFAEQSGNVEVLQLLERYSNTAQKERFKRSRKAHEVKAKFNDEPLARVKPRVKRSAAEHYSAFPLTTWPTTARKISLAFDDSSRQFTGKDSLHHAWDFPAPEGTPIVAVADGDVIKVGHSHAHGNYLMLDHGQGYTTKYTNNKVIEVAKGDAVKVGQKIALVGDSSADSTGPHLHFEVRFEGKRIDPAMLYSR